MGITKIIALNGLSIGIILGLYAMFVEPFSLRITNHTIKTDKWKSDNWSNEITEKVKGLKEIEPNEDTKKNIGRLINGEELE